MGFGGPKSHGTGDPGDPHCGPSPPLQDRFACPLEPWCSRIAAFSDLMLGGDVQKYHGIYGMQNLLFSGHKC